GLVLVKSICLAHAVVLFPQLQPTPSVKHRIIRNVLVHLAVELQSASWKFFDSTCAYFKELSFSRLRELYERLDMDNDGTVDIRDLTAALKREMPHIPERLAPKLMARISAGNDDKVNFAEFVKYVVEHEKRLEAIFQDLDKNNDGFIDMREIKTFCSEHGISLDDKKAQGIVESMDRSGSSSVDLSEFQQFMLLYPSSDVKDMVDFWRHNLVIDIGEDSQVPEDFSDQEMISGVWWRHLVAGGIAGCMSRTCTAPFDRLKVFMQVHSTRTNNLGVFSSLRLLYAEGGVKSFWRGNGINVIKIAPESAIKFMAYEQCKRLIQKYKNGGDLTIVERFLAGSTAGAISQTLIYPMEVLKTRLALRKTGQLDNGLIHFAQKMWKKEGPICFYKGYVPNLLGIIPYAGIDLAIYETLKKLYVTHHKDGSEPGVLALLACGTCSSTCGQLASYPLALVRTRLQARAISGDPLQPDTMTGQFRYILSNEGFFGLYRGIAPNFMKVIPAVSISYVVYEHVRKQLGATMS
ncbi:unnamed protein product, partial [Heligmosomoides polygyrus]|uniref:EF-hand domain-containing protein n=1 Tax=Heligmosomoides polygyrus TaxID=6339 RepID=A0A183FL51_HELPZ